MKQKNLEYIPLLVLGCIFCVVFFCFPEARQSWLISTTLKNGAYCGIIALGILPILIGGDIDLSLGAQLTFFGILCATLLKIDVPLVVSICLTLVAAILFGCAQGALVAGWNMSSVLVTIGSSMLLNGLTSILNKDATIFNLPKQLTYLGSQKIGGLAMPTVMWLLSAAIMALILSQTYWGKFFYAVGCNHVASRKVGVPILKTKMVAFALDSFFCAASSIIYISQLGFAPQSSAQDVTHSVLTIAALGGVSFSGGRGKVQLVLLGGLMVSMLTSIFSTTRISSDYQNCIKAAILFVALFTNFSKA